VQNVKNLLQSNNNPEPLFNVDKITVFEVVVPIAGPDDAYEEDSHQVESSKNGGKNVGGNGGKNVGGKSIELSRKIIGVISTEPTLKIREIAKSLGVTSRTIERHIKSLRETGIIEHQGATKAGKWVVLPKASPTTKNK